MNQEEMNKLIQEILSRNPPSIKNKKECYTLYESDFFGNKIKSWNSYEKLLESNHQGTVSIRSKRVSWKTRFNLPISRLPEILKELKKQKIEPNELRFSETPPDSQLIFQGEIMRNHEGIYLLYSDLKYPMSIALRKKQKSIRGLKALNFLKSNLDSSSFDNILDLLDLFPKNVIEFSTFSCNLGKIRGRNTIIWEVRGY
jgi:hypothetical protein